ncbi:MAG: YkgJ family cysteine cluster protein [Armatimonadota bacterium]
MHELTVLRDVQRFVSGIDQSPCNGCDECGARCIDGVPMLLPEFRAIRELLESEEGAEARRVELLPKVVPYPGTEMEDGVLYTACRFRDVERGCCSIYPVRPQVCRLFGHVEWLPCPIARIPAPAEGALAAMRRYGEAPQKTYEEWLQCESSL